MTDPELKPQTETNIAQVIDQQNDFIEHYKIQEIPVCLEGLCQPEEEQI